MLITELELHANLKLKERNIISKLFSNSRERADSSKSLTYRNNRISNGNASPPNKSSACSVDVRQGVSMDLLIP